VEGGGGADLLAPSVEEEVSDGEEEGEEEGVGEVGVGVVVWIRVGLFEGFAGGRGAVGSPANFHLSG